MKGEKIPSAEGKLLLIRSSIAIHAHHTEFTMRAHCRCDSSAGCHLSAFSRDPCDGALGACGRELANASRRSSSVSACDDKLLTLPTVIPPHRESAEAQRLVTFSRPACLPAFQGTMKTTSLAACLLAGMLSQLGCEIGVEQPQTAGQTQSTSRATDTQAGNQLAKGNLRFVAGYRQGYAVSAREGKPMLLFFTASWCEYCRQMANEAFTNPQVVNLSANFVCVLIDADAEPDVCRQFQVTGYPTIQFLSPRGVPLERVVGKKPGHQVMMAMQSALQHVARRSSLPETSQQ
jgi:thiol-disulfide isomerase/thioredoxin